MQRVFKYLFKPREVLSRFILLRLIRDPHVSIISDDCWGAEYYRELGLSYLTPTVGLWIQATDYIDFISDLRGSLEADLEFVEENFGYPVAVVNGCKIGFMHYKSKDEAWAKWKRRCSRVDHERLFFKVDFGRPHFTQKDIQRWNELALPNAVALLDDGSELDVSAVHQGIHIPDWDLNGAAMYEISKQYFSLSNWINTGKIQKTRHQALLDFLLFDRRHPQRLSRLFN